MLWVLLACIKPSDGPPLEVVVQDDTHTSQDSHDTGDTGPDVETLCDNGVDDDADGLIDCEDPDCVDACTETLCDDTVDNDADGDTDCDDTDCWGLAVCVSETHARVVSGQRTAQGRDYAWGSRSDSYTVIENSQQLESVVGELRVGSPGGWTTCSWTGRADAAWRWQMSNNVDVYFGAHALTWESVHVESACRDLVQTSTFLPTILNGRDAIRYTSNGTSWYSPAPADFLAGGSRTWTWKTTSRWGTSYSPSARYTLSWRSAGALSTGAWFVPPAD